VSRSPLSRLTQVRFPSVCVGANRSVEDTLSLQHSATITNPCCNPTIRLTLALARYSPDDQYSKQRIKNLKRHGLLLTQQPPKKF